jgi:hypothetical protein
VRERERERERERKTSTHPHTEVHAYALEQFENGEHDVVDVAEARGLTLLGVVQATRPVDADVRLREVQLGGGRCRGCHGMVVSEREKRERKRKRERERERVCV